MRKVILTFDDGWKSHFDIVRPRLLEYGYGATFFICGKWIERDEETVTWDQVLTLNDDGFEIGNHTYEHADLTKLNFEQIVKNEQVFAQLGLPKPISLGYPGFHVNMQVMNAVNKLGYKFARAGCRRRLPFEKFQKGGSGTTFNPLYDNCLNINCLGIFGNQYGIPQFQFDIQKCRDSDIGVFCFHNFHKSARFNTGKYKGPLDISIKSFETFLEHLKKMKCQVISFKDLPTEVSVAAETEGNK
jgi:hypothetical protein